MNGDYSSDNVGGDHRGSSSSDYSNWQPDSETCRASHSSPSLRRDSCTPAMPFGYDNSGIEKFGPQATCCPVSMQQTASCFPPSQSFFDDTTANRTMSWPTNPLQSRMGMSSLVNSLPNNNALENRQLPIPNAGRFNALPNTPGNLATMPQQSANLYRNSSNWEGDAFHQHDLGMHAENCPAARRASLGSVPPQTLPVASLGYVPYNQSENTTSAYNSTAMGPPAGRYNTQSGTAGHARASQPSMDIDTETSNPFSSTVNDTVPNLQELPRSTSDYNLYSFGNDSLFNAASETPAPPVSNLRASNTHLSAPQDDLYGARRQSIRGPSSGRLGRSSGSFEMHRRH